MADDELETDFTPSDPEALYRQLVEQAPDSPLPRFSLARLLVTGGRCVEAVEHLRLCVAAQDDWAVAWLLLGDALRGSGDLEGAREAWERGRALGLRQNHGSLVEEADEKLASV